MQHEISRQPTLLRIPGQIPDQNVAWFGSEIATGDSQPLVFEVEGCLSENAPRQLDLENFFLFLQIPDSDLLFPRSKCQSSAVRAEGEPAQCGLGNSTQDVQCSRL